MNKTEELCRLCRVADLAEGQPHRVQLPGREAFAVYLIGGQIFVTDDTCTHGKASLADEGDLDGFTIVCTWHDGAFDVRTGEVKSLPCTEPIRSYQALIQDGAVLVALPNT